MSKALTGTPQERHAARHLLDARAFPHTVPLRLTPSAFLQVLRFAIEEFGPHAAPAAAQPIGEEWYYELCPETITAPDEIVANVHFRSALHATMLALRAA